MSLKAVQNSLKWVSFTFPSRRRSKTFQALFATVRSAQQATKLDLDKVEIPDNDFILSILRANPNSRDTKAYFDSFSAEPRKSSPPKLVAPTDVPSPSTINQTVDNASTDPDLRANTIAQSILSPIHRRTALVKLQGPFTDNQLDSIARGIVYLEKLGVVSVIVIERDDLVRGEENDRAETTAETMRVVTGLEKQGAKARPVLDAFVRLGPHPSDSNSTTQDIVIPEAHTNPSDLMSIRSALKSGEIPVVPPFALDSFCRSVRIGANDLIGALARGMVEAASVSSQDPSNEEIDLTPLRLMIINREGGVPSYARKGYPHLLVNLCSEYSYIKETFDDRWKESHPTALSNLALAKACLSYMPPTSSAIMVSHKSPSSLIGHLITNKPAISSSLPHALLQNNSKINTHTPTLLRKGLPIQVLRSPDEIDRPKLDALLEQSFKRKLNAEPFYDRLEKSLDFVIVAGDYAGAAIVTDERPSNPNLPPISYLDKFAVLPSHQGDGTVDFLWVALHDETYGLGLSFSVNPNGGKQGLGEGRDLVWRSRANNPVNKWYFERSTGFLRQGEWVVFWCDAERRLKAEGANKQLSFVEGWEEGRLVMWAETLTKIPSCWK